MFNRGNKPGSNIGRSGDKSNNRNSSGFQQQVPNNALTFAGSRGLVNGTTGLLMGSSSTAQHQQNPSAIVTQTQALARQQQQQQLLRAHNNSNPMGTFKMTSNLQEQMLIKQQLHSIKQELQQREANKLRAELQAASQQVPQSGLGGRNTIGILSSGAKHIPSTSNSSVVPNKQREDEMTKPDLSTLAETAVAVATATSSARSTSNIRGNNHIAALLGRRNAPSAISKESMPSSLTNSLANSSMTDILRRDLGANRGKLHLGQNYKRSLDEMNKSNTNPSSSSWLWKSAGLGSATLSMAELRAQHEQLQRRNSLPARSSPASSDFASLRSLKRQKLMDEKVKEIERLEMQDAMKRVRQLDASMNIGVPRNPSFLAEMASKLVSQERRSSLASSVASAGTSATAPNMSMNSSLTSPVNLRSLNMLESNINERSKILEKLSKLGGGFPMPKFHNESPIVSTQGFSMSGGFKNNVPAKITPEAGKDILDVMGRGSVSLQQQLESVKQSRLGGFPMPPLYMHNNENQGDIQFDGAMNISVSNNAISSHIRNNVNRGSTKASRPPSLESYKRVWREIRLVAGDDPSVDERLRKEVFARKLQRGEIFVGKMGKNINTISNSRFINSHNVQQRRLSDMSIASGSSNTGRRTQSGATPEGSVII
eukprot:CAMPEP_0116084826 /NCGR_PEP_ID=MMETSP0327-20121206/4003_1 /TAXON_ID=44447 /ORGANISM="Pseudo-nitzschia delicatissima, Strain B596" /LENGTH=655 /DNA_ID=CAMNT_0003575785 /DNA_START=320 /DNA_END=2287 /DNA_ORIENTATION=-